MSLEKRVDILEIQNAKPCDPVYIFLCHEPGEDREMIEAKEAEALKTYLQKHGDNHLFITIIAPNSETIELTKGLLKGEGRMRPS